MEDLTQAPAFNEMQQIKRHFFALRNGIIADTIRKAGYDYKIIFGLNLPQLKEIAQSTSINKELSLMLRANVTTRESLLLATMLYPVESLTFDDAVSWAEECQTTEVSDILCHTLLRRFDEAERLCKVLVGGSSIMGRYTGLRLLLNLNVRIDDNIKAVCKKEITDSTPLRYIARQVLTDKCE